MLVRNARPCGGRGRSMNCTDAKELLHPYIDGELPALDQVRMEEHLAGCGECQAQVTQLQALRQSLAAPELYYRAPAACRREVMRSVGGSESPRRLSAPLIAATMLLAASLFGVAVWLSSPS